MSLTIRIAFHSAYPWVLCCDGEPMVYCETYSRAAGLLK